MPSNKKVLIVAAHPDDEVLGCGGTMARHHKQGDEVHVVFMADGVSSRTKISLSSTDIEVRNKAAAAACKILHAQPAHFFSFPDNRMDAIPLIDIVQQLEKLISSIAPETIYTHNGSDLNVDHRITHEAVMTACRPQPDYPVKEIYSFEILSSTEWISVVANRPFSPNYFVDIGMTLALKMEALQVYHEEMRDFPHSRSYEGVGALARYRGVSVGVEAAEAFQVERILR